MKHVRQLVFVAALLVLVPALTLPLAGPAEAQIIPLPNVSPHSVVTGTVGLTEVTIDYHSPGVKERPIWGALVPWDAVWRAGANQNTVITFSHPVQIEGQDLAAGNYGLHMIPTEGDWTVIFSRNHSSWGSFSYDEEEDVLRVTVTPETGDHEEWLRYGFTDLTADSATAYLAWEQVRVPFEIATDTAAIVIQTARDQLRSMPGFFWRDYFRAANWVLQNDGDNPESVEQALEWADASIQREERFLNLWLKSRLLAKLERNPEEQETLLARASEIANENEMNALGYQHLQAGDADKAVEVFRANLERNPESWNCHDSLGEGLVAAGHTEEAIAHYKKALEMAPEGQHARIEGVLEGLEAD